MDAILSHGDDTPSTVVRVKPARAFPPYIFYEGYVYQCRNPASAFGEYDRLGRCEQGTLVKFEDKK